MTEREEQELKRIEANILRLRELILRQQEIIRGLKEALRERTVELEHCRILLTDAERQRDIRQDASALASLWGADAIGRIDEMIYEVSCCIAQLEAEQ